MKIKKLSEMNDDECAKVVKKFKDLLLSEMALDAVTSLEFGADGSFKICGNNECHEVSLILKPKKLQRIVWA